MPLLRAKIPLNVLSFPFQSGIVAGETKELSLNLSTYFDAGPAFKIAYRPNNPHNPFSFICKTGIGNFGSPISSPFTMSAEFNFVGNQNPSFFLHFKPKFGDFSIKKSHSSADLVKKVEPRVNGGAGKTEETPLVKRGYVEEPWLFAGAGKIAVLPVESAAVATGVMENVVSGAEVKATTAFPLGGRATMNLRWWLRFPPNTAADREEDAVIVGKTEPRAGISFRKFPTLLMDKISIEHVAKKDLNDSKSVGSGSNLAGSSEDVAGMCMEVKKQLETIQSENGLLKKALNDLRSEIAAGNMDLASSAWDSSHGGNKSSGSGRVDRKEPVVDGKTKAVEVDVNRGFKNAAKGANVA